MKNHVDLIQDKTIQSVRVANSQKSGDNGPRFQLTDNRPESKEVAQLQSKISNSGLRISDVQFPSVVQRYTSVKDVVYDNDKEENVAFQELKSRYLDVFLNIQIFLSNISRTKPHLQALNAKMQNTPDLSALLTELMPEWQAQLVRLTDPVPEADFLAMAKEGKIFEDLWIFRLEEN